MKFTHHVEQRMMQIKFCLLSLCFSVTAAEQTARTWTNTDGREIVATYLSVDGENVMLKLANGKTVPYPITKLSQRDQEFISDLQEKRIDKTTTTPTVEDKTLNFDQPWPEKVVFRDDAEIEIVTEDPANKQFVYRSRNYEFKCDVRLNRSVVKSFSEMFEATYEYCRAIPLALTASQKSDKKLSILLFETKESYIRAGGPPPSAGVYMPSTNLIMVPLESLGVKKLGSGYSIDRKKTNQTLPHEITHQLTPLDYFAPGSMGWFSEGIAEYVVTTPYQNGVYRAKGNFTEVKSYVTEFGKGDKGGRNLGENIIVGSLEQFMLQDYDSFTKNGNFNYGVGLLITSYFIHLDGNGDCARLKRFLQALRAGKKGSAALEMLLDGRTFAELENEISQKFKKERINVVFGAK